MYGSVGKKCILILILMVAVLTCSCGAKYDVQEHHDLVQKAQENWNQITDFAVDDFSQFDNFEEAVNRYQKDLSELEKYEKKYNDDLEDQIKELIKDFGQIKEDADLYVGAYKECYHENKPLVEMDLLSSEVSNYFFKYTYSLDKQMHPEKYKEKEKTKISSGEELWGYLEENYPVVTYDEIKGGNYEPGYVLIDGVIKGIKSEEYDGNRDYDFAIYYPLKNGTFYTDKGGSLLYTDSMDDLPKSEELDIADDNIRVKDLENAKDNDSFRFLMEVFEDGSLSRIPLAVKKIPPITNKKIKIKTEKPTEAISKEPTDSGDSNILYDNYIDELKENGVVTRVDEIEDGVWVILVNSSWYSLTTQQKETLTNGIYENFNAYSKGNYGLDATIEVNDVNGNTVAASKWTGGGMKLKQ